MEYYYTYYFRKPELDFRARPIDRELINLYCDCCQARCDNVLITQSKGYDVNVKVGATVLTIHGFRGFLNLRKWLMGNNYNSGKPSMLRQFLDESLIGIDDHQVDLIFTFLPYTGPIACLYADGFRPEMEANLRKFLWAKTKYPEL